MTDGINGSNSLSSIDHARDRVSDGRPPSGEPIGAPKAKPDVAVAISDLAQARFDTLMQPAVSDSATGGQVSDNGGFEYGVDRGGFDWPLDAESKSTASAGPSESMEAWQTSKNVVNGVYNSDVDASQSAYIALGKTSVNAAD